MQFLIVLAAVVCAASAGFIGAPTSIVRAPAYDSAVIKSDRLGGNFAYSTAENHAYAAVSPIVQHVATPVAVSYSAPAIAHAAPLAYSGLYNQGLIGNAYGYAGLAGGYYGNAGVLAL